MADGGHIANRKIAIYQR